MKIVLLTTIILISFLSGCASVPMESKDMTVSAKKFNPPSPGKAGLYIYREDTHFGAALVKSIWVDKECVGETAKGVFFYHEVDGDKDHTISTESEFSPNDLVINMKKGMHYFVKQFIKFGVFIGGAGLVQKDEKTGKSELSELGMAKKGTCYSGSEEIQGSGDY